MYLFLMWILRCFYTWGVFSLLINSQLTLTECTARRPPLRLGGGPPFCGPGPFVLPFAVSAAQEKEKHGVCDVDWWHIELRSGSDQGNNTVSLASVTDGTTLLDITI